MMLHCFLQQLASRQSADNFPAHASVHFYQIKLLVSKWAGLVEHALGDKDFSHIMHPGGIGKVIDFLGR